MGYFGLKRLLDTNAETRTQSPRCLCNFGAYYSSGFRGTPSQRFGSGAPALIVRQTHRFTQSGHMVAKSITAAAFGAQYLRELDREPIEHTRSALATACGAWPWTTCSRPSGGSSINARQIRAAGISGSQKRATLLPKRCIGLLGIK